MFENTQVFNFEGAFYELIKTLGHEKYSDSFFGLINTQNDFPDVDYIADEWIDQENIKRIEAGLEPYSDEMEDYKQYYELIDKYAEWMRTVGILKEDLDLAEVAFLGPKDLELAQKAIRNNQYSFLSLICVSYIRENHNYIINYEDLRNIYLQLNTDKEMLEWIKTLPYGMELIMLEELE